MAALVIAFDWDAMRKIVSIFIGLEASRSRQPSAFSVDGSSVSQDERDEAGHAVLLDVVLERVVQPRHAIGGCRRRCRRLLGVRAPVERQGDRACKQSNGQRNASDACGPSQPTVTFFTPRAVSSAGSLLR